MSKVDITHTTSPKDRPHPDAKLIRNLDTNEVAWVVPAEELSEPGPLQGKPSLGDDDGKTGEPEPEITTPPVKMPTIDKVKGKK